MPRPLWPHQKSYIHIFSSFNFPSSAKDLRPRTFYFELLFLLRPCLIFISPLNRARKKPSLASPNLSLSFSHRISLPICSPFTVFLSAKVAPNKCPPPPTLAFAFLRGLASALFFLGDLYDYFVFPLQKLFVLLLLTSLFPWYSPSPFPRGMGGKKNQANHFKNCNGIRK